MLRKIVVTGFGQIKQGKEKRSPVLSPVELMAEAARMAETASGVANILKTLDAVMVVKVMSHFYDNAADELSHHIGAAPRLKYVSKIGGNSPQQLVNTAAGMIARGELDTVLIAGGETYYPRDKTQKDTGSVLFKGLDEIHPEDDLVGCTPEEARHGIVLPVQGFPLFETALWAESGLDIDTYRFNVGKRWSQFSHTARNNPYAWLQQPKSPEEIVTPTPVNRMVVFPYTKFMTALVTVDQAAAILLTTEENAKRSGSNGKNRVYFRGGAYAEDRQRFLIQRTKFTQSPPLRTAAKKALRRSGFALDEIECFDIYSCFPCSVAIARKMIGISDGDDRPLTLTGGLGFFGGPGNNYSLHAIATLAESISEGKFNNGMITSLGWFIHKHAVGVYSSAPPDHDVSTHDIEDKENFLSGDTPAPLREQVSGKGEIETYTVIHDRDGEPSYAVIYGISEKGFRFVANSPRDKLIFKKLMSANYVGKTVRLSHDAAAGINIADIVD